MYTEHECTINTSVNDCHAGTAQSALHDVIPTSRKCALACAYLQDVSQSIKCTVCTGPVCVCVCVCVRVHMCVCLCAHACILAAAIIVHILRYYAAVAVVAAVAVAVATRTSLEL